MICVEDALDSLSWVESIGGNKELIKRSKNNLEIVTDWVKKSDWIKFLHNNIETRSSTSITLKIKDNWFNKFDEETQRKKIKEMIEILNKEKVAYDINGYNKAPPSLRIWGGATVENKNMQLLLPWLDWAYYKIKNEK